MNRMRRTSTNGLGWCLLAGLAALAVALAGCGAPGPAMIAKVVVTMPGSPEHLERALAMPLEEALSGVASVRHIRSWIHDDTVEVAVELADEDLAPVRDAIDRTRRQLPADASVPTLERTAAGAPKWLYTRVRDEPHGRDERYDLLATRLRSVLERQAGVRSVDVCGARSRELEVLIDPEALSRFGLAPTDVATALTTLADVPAGRIEGGDHEVVLRARATPTSLDELRDAPLRTLAGGGPVRLRDVARISATVTPVDCFAAFDDSGVVAIGVSADGEVTSDGLALESVADGRTVVVPIGTLNDHELAHVAVQISRELHALVVVDRSPSWDGRGLPPGGPTVTIVASGGVEPERLRDAFALIPGSRPTVASDYVIDRDKAAALGVSAADLRDTLGLVAGRVIAQLGDGTPMRLRVAAESADDTYRRSRVRATDGSLVSLEQLGAIREDVVAPIVRVDRQRVPSPPSDVSSPGSAPR